MANIIIVNESYQNEDAVYNTINYVFGSEYYQYSGAVGLLWCYSQQNITENYHSCLSTI